MSSSLISGGLPEENGLVAEAVLELDREMAGRDFETATFGLG